MPDPTQVVSIIVPVFNVGQHLIKCLQSITSQTYAHLEIILIDDGSTDSSPAVVREFAERDDRIHVITQANAGVSNARNSGLDAATGDYAMFVDADDWLEVNAIEIAVGQAIERNLDFVTFGYFVDSPEGSTVGAMLDKFQGTLDTRTSLETVLTTQNRFVFTRLYHRALVDSIRFREDIHWGEDTVFVVELARRAQSSAVIHKPLYHYVQSEGSATRSKVNPKRLTGPKMTDILEESVKDDHPHLVDYVLQTRVNILAVLIQDSFELPPSESKHLLKELTSRLRSDLPRVLRSQAISAPIKIKATMIAFSPRLFVETRRLLTKLRSVRG